MTKQTLPNRFMHENTSHGMLFFANLENSKFGEACSYYNEPLKKHVVVGVKGNFEGIINFMD